MKLLEKLEQGSVGASHLAEKSDPDAWLVCAACGHGITRLSSKLEVAGATSHVFMNPAGHLFEIGCFRSAPGTTCFGESSTEWSWFPGYSWTVAVCASCRIHVGWRFDARSGEDVFHGLIHDRLASSG